MGKPIILSDEQIAQLQEEGRIVSDGQPIRTEVTEGPRKFFRTIAEAIAAGDPVETFASEEQFCVMEERGRPNHESNYWYAGMDMGGLWMVARMRQETKNLDSGNTDPHEFPSMTGPTNTEDYCKANFYEGELDREPENSEEFTEYVHDWMFPSSFNDDDSPEPLDDALYGEDQMHNWEWQLDDIFAYYG